MVYCLNYQCPHPENPEGGNFCLYCGQKLWLGHRFSGLSLKQQGHKGRTILGLDRSSHPVSYCIIKQSVVNDSTIDRAFITDFQHNVQQLRELGHRREFPTVLHALIPKNIHDLRVLPTVVFEKIQGESLHQQFNRLGKFSEADIEAFLSAVLPLLQTLHDHELVHRDLNPHNLLFTPEQHWAIVDFTAAKITPSPSAQPGTLIGSGAYTAPEQLNGQSYPASDLYSLGAMCLELLTMVHPFELFSDLENRWVWEDYLTMPISTPLKNLLNSLVAPKVGDRPVSAQAALAKLQKKAVRLPVGAMASGTLAAASVSAFKITSAKITGSRPVGVKNIAPPPVAEQWYCTKTLKGHRGYISDLNFDATGKFLASASADQTIRIWNTEYRWEVSCLRGHRGIVSGAKFVGSQIVSNSWDYTVRFWDWQHNHDNPEDDRLEARPTWLLSSTLLDHSKKLAILGADHHVMLWDLPTKQFLESWPIEDTCLLRGDRQSTAVITANDDTLWLWQNQEKMATFSGHIRKITAFDISPTGKFLVSAAADNTLRIWSVLTQTCDKMYRIQDPIKSLAIFPNQRFFATGDEAGNFKIWQLGQHRPVVSFGEHTGAIEAIAIAPDNKMIATGSQDKTIKLWRFGLQ